MFSFFMAFFLLGFTVGNLLGISQTSLVQSLVGLLFAFVGGSAIAFLSKIPQKERKNATTSISALSIGCILGVYLSIYISNNNLLGEKSENQKQLLEIIDNKLQSLSEKTNTQFDQNYIQLLKEYKDIANKVDQSNYLRSNKLDKLKLIEIELDNTGDYETAYKNLKHILVDK